MITRHQKPLWLIIILSFSMSLSVYADAPNQTRQKLTKKELRVQRRLEKRQARKLRRRQRKIKRVERFLKSKLGKNLLHKTIKKSPSNEHFNTGLGLGLVGAAGVLTPLIVMSAQTLGFTLLVGAVLLFIVGVGLLLAGIIVMLASSLG